MRHYKGWFSASWDRMLFWIAVTVLLPIGPAHAQGPPAPAPYLRTPSQRQLQWHRMEYYAFVHFGPNTFTNEEWGRSQMAPDVFNPTNLDTDQWAKTFADAGMAGMILTAKHHDGMALWNTSTTAYSVTRSAWARNRTSHGLDADVVRMAARSAAKYGIRFGVYLSPWDIHRDPAMPKPRLAGTPYDEPQIFGDDTPGDYNDLYAAQLTELVTMSLDHETNCSFSNISLNSALSTPSSSSNDTRVNLFEIWLDGNSGSDTRQTFAWARFRDIIRAHQPDAVMWGHQGVDARWVGNEDGSAPATGWHAVSRTQDQPHYAPEQLGAGVRDGLYWTPAEADARVRDGWFYHAEERPKAAGALMEMYLRCVGRGVNLLLDVPPAKTGRVDKADADVLGEFRRLRDAFLGRGLLGGSTAGADTGVVASSIWGGNSTQFGAASVIDGREDTYWAVKDGETTGWIEVDLGGSCAVDAFIVQEHIALGQRIGGYAIDVAGGDGLYKTVVTGTSMGYKRIDRLDRAVDAAKIRLRITQANAVPLVQSIQALGTRKSSE